MKVKMILPARSTAPSHSSCHYITHALFPPIGLASLAGYLSDHDDVEILDEHVESVTLNDTPDVVVIQTYTHNAWRAYELADHYRLRGAYVCLGGLHVTAVPDEASLHADSIFLGPGEDTWPRFLADFRVGTPRSVYRSVKRCLTEAPPVRRDLIQRHRYLCPNALVVSRGCPHRCDFCTKENFYEGGKSFYTQSVDQALSQIEQLPGRHLFFMDNHLFGDRQFATALFEGMRGMGRLWQAAATVHSILQPGLLEKAVESGLRSLLIGFETLDDANLESIGKFHNLHENYERVVKRCRRLGVMVNARFVFGMDHDDLSVFDRTVDWAVRNGVEMATFEILTPYPGTRLYDRLKKQGRILTEDWSRYDTRHAVYKPVKMDAMELEAGFEQACAEFDRWPAVWKAAMTKPDYKRQLHHLAVAAGRKTIDPVWTAARRSGQLRRLVPLMEALLAGFGPYPVPVVQSSPRSLQRHKENPALSL
jgi:radical SAM superfamily enzyme YgiQ (UPF0313 family)